MKFKEFIQNNKINDSRNNVLKSLELCLNDLNNLNEIDTAIEKLDTLQKVAKNINALEIHLVFKKIKNFLSSKVSNTKISDLQITANSVIRELDMAIKKLLTIKHLIKTKFLDSLISNASKLSNNIKEHIKTQLDDYNKNLLK